jgi:hypothetical protein
VRARIRSQAGGRRLVKALCGSLPLWVSVSESFPDPVVANRAHATLSFTTSKPGNVKVEIFDLRGCRVRTNLGSVFMAAGSHDLKIDGRGE